VELQLKATSRDLVRDDRITFPLDIKNYNDLRTENVLVPRILVVVILPEDINCWLVQSEEEMCLKHCGYWTSLSGMKETKNKGSVTITIPRDRRFTSETLHQMMERIGRGEAL
jgi:hypothetical protein